MYGWLYKKILFVVAFISHRVYSTPQRVREWILIRVIKRSQSYTLIKNDLPKDSEKIAILVAFARSPMLESVKRSIVLLKNQGVHVVLIMNDNTSTETWINALKDDVDTLFIRPNIGRDFGAYQSGIQFLKEKGFYNTISELFLLNDSVYYTPISLTKLNDFVNVQKPWKSLFLNFQYKIHAQSFFLSFGREILDSRAFNKYWNNYYPTSIRRRVVVNGELRLTKKLISAGFMVTPFINAQTIEDALNHSPMTPSEELSAYGDFFQVSGLVSERESESRQKIELLRRVLDNKNPTHHLGLLTTRLLGTPLKMDIVMRGITSLGSVHECLLLAQVPLPEVESFVSEISMRGTKAGHFGITKIWRLFGFE